jgi:hypothetical protein
MIGWGPISTSFFEFEIIISYDVGCVEEVVVFLFFLNVASNSSSNSLLLCLCLKTWISYVVVTHEASGST